MRYLNKWVSNKLSLPRMALSSLLPLLLLALVWGTNGRHLPPSPPNGGSGFENLAALRIVAQQDEEGEGEGEGEDGEESQRQTPTGLTQVVVARVDIPTGEPLREDLVEIEFRPADNVAVRAGVTVSDPEDLVGRIVKTDIARGQAIMTPMIALSPTDLASSGSDLAVHVDNGRVAIAFPINQYSGAAYAMRPGDFVDVLMSFNLIELDVEFQTPLPNRTALVDEDALAEGEQFLFPSITQGRLELIPELGAVGEITPRGIIEAAGEDVAVLEDTIVQQEPRRVTQLTIQQAEVLWVGDWLSIGNLFQFQGPNNYALKERLAELENEVAQLSPAEQRAFADEFGFAATTARTLESFARTRLDFVAPDIAILSLPVQDALTLKWAFEEPGINTTLLLRSQGDNALYFTTSVSLPQLVEQAGLTIPDPSQFGLNPYIGNNPPIRLPPFNIVDPSVFIVER